MAKKRKKRRRKRSKHPCELGWRVRWTEEFRHDAVRLGLWRDVKRLLKELERSIRDGKGLRELLGNPVIGYTVHRRRRYELRRMYVGKRTARAFYVVRMDICRVWFVRLMPRTNGLYRHRRW